MHTVQGDDRIVYILHCQCSVSGLCVCRSNMVAFALASMQHGNVQRHAPTLSYALHSGRRAVAFRSLNHHVTRKPLKLLVSSVHGSGGKSTPSDDNQGSTGPSKHKSAAEGPRDEAKTPSAGKVPIAGRPTAQTPHSDRPAKPGPPAANRDIPKTSPRSQTSSSQAAAWEQGAAGDWNPGESKPDFVGKFPLLARTAPLLATVCSLGMASLGIRHTISMLCNIAPLLGPAAAVVLRASEL